MARQDIIRLHPGAAMEHAEPTPVHCLPEARWACEGCGLCCERFTLGPLSQETWFRIGEGLLRGRGSQVGRAWYESRSFSESTHGFYLTRRDGACVFLDEQKHCAVHRLLGEEAKPEFCRLFPFSLTPAPDGIRVTVRTTCPRWFSSRHHGAPLGPQVAPLLPLASVKPSSFSGLVQLLPGLGVDHASWTAAEAALLRVAAATEGPPEHRVAALRRAITRALGRPELPTVPAASTWAREQLLDLLRTTLRAAAPGPEDADPRAELWRRCLVWLGRLAPDTPPRACDPEAEDYLGLVLRSGIFGGGALGSGGLPVHLGAFLLETWVIRASAPDERLSAAVVAQRLAIWQTVAAHGAVRAALGRAHPFLTDLFLHADGL